LLSAASFALEGHLAQSTFVEAHEEDTFTHNDDFRQVLVQEHLIAHELEADRAPLSCFCFVI
jgi:hypothetical protein